MLISSDVPNKSPTEAILVPLGTSRPGKGNDLPITTCKGFKPSSSWCQDFLWLKRLRLWNNHLDQINLKKEENYLERKKSEVSYKMKITNPPGPHEDLMDDSEPWKGVKGQPWVWLPRTMHLPHTGKKTQLEPTPEDSTWGFQTASDTGRLPIFIHEAN